ncbi:MAG: peptidoglycan-binding protein, partial [Alphaproteobacteria bacterium]|nr:peptidoglycan-binding protein [Alphaproteobacteria bacterium]
ATEPDPDRFRAEIDAFIARLGPSSNGAVTWAGSDPYEVRRDGEGLAAVIANARLSLNTPQPSQLTLDRIEIREIGRMEGGELVELALALPKSMILNDPDGAETKIELQNAKARTVMEAVSGRGRETVIEIAGARIEQARTGTWVSLGPLSMSSKLVAEPNGGWSGPVEFDARDIEYFLPQAPVGGSIDQISFVGKSAGPRLKELDKLRDAVDRLQAEDGKSPQARGAAFLAALPTISEPFSTIRGQLVVKGLAVRAVTGEKLVAVAKAGSTAEITGLDTHEAALRFGIYQEDLELAPSILEKWKVPRRAMLDIGLVDLGTQPLKDLLSALITATDEQASGESESNVYKQLALQQALGAAAKLNPTFHIYDITVDTEDVGLSLTAEAKGSPLAPKGYTAAADVIVRGFDEIPKLSGGIPFAEYLPVLREIGTEGTAPDGTPRLQFHLTSAAGQWIVINGNDVSAWFDGTQAAAGQQRVLKPTDPPMRGADVESVQRALAAAQMPVAQDGEYNSATASAVARFQKEKGLNVSGVVDTATRQRLGGSGDPLRRGGRN